MKKLELKEIITEAVISKLNEETWKDIESKIDKWFKLSPGLTGNVESVKVVPEAGIRKAIVLHDKRGNNIALVRGASTEFVEKYLPILANLLTTVSGQEASAKGKDVVTFK